MKQWDRNHWGPQSSVCTCGCFFTLKRPRLKCHTQTHNVAFQQVFHLQPAGTIKQLIRHRGNSNIKAKKDEWSWRNLQLQKIHHRKCSSTVTVGQGGFVPHEDRKQLLQPLYLFYILTAYYKVERAKLVWGDLTGKAAARCGDHLWK